MKQEQDKKSNKKLLGINLLAMLAVAIAVPFVALAWLDSYTEHGKVIPVPDVCGMPLGDAAEALRAKNLDFEIVDYKYVKGVDADKVLEQRPLANANVKNGRKIELTMSSSHVPMQVIPDVIDNCSLREAEARLRASGFKLGNTIKVEGEKDWVYSLMLGKDTLRNGNSIPAGSTVVLVIGSGEDKETDEPIIDESWFE